MYDDNNDIHNIRNFIFGFADGLFAPVTELLFGVYLGIAITVATTMSTTTGTPNSSANISLIFGIIFAVDILRNIISCLIHTYFAFGNVFGNIFGLIIFYKAISFISPESANSSLLLTFLMLISLIIGVFVAVWRAKKREDRYSEYSLPI